MRHLNAEKTFQGKPFYNWDIIGKETIAVSVSDMTVSASMLCADTVKNNGMLIDFIGTPRKRKPPNSFIEFRG